MPPRPHLFDDVSVGLSNLSLHPQRVGEVQFLEVGALQEVLRQGRSVTQTLWGQKETGGVRMDIDKVELVKGKHEHRGVNIL